MKNYKVLLSVFCLSACLAACSGGGGGNNAPQNPPRGNQPPQQIPPQKKNPQPQSPDKKTEQPQSPESGKKPEQPKLPDSGRNPQQPPQTNPIPPQPPKVEAPQPEAKAYFTETVNKDGQNKDMRWNSSAIKKDFIPVYDIDFIEDTNGNYSFVKEEVIVKAPSKKTNNNHHDITLLDDDFFYGYYFNLDNENILFSNYFYAFSPQIENKNVPSNITANYSKSNGFSYTIRNSNVEKHHSGNVDVADVNIQFANGEIIKGEISKKEKGKHVQLFEVEKGKTINQLIFTPKNNSFIKDTDKGTADIHYLNSTKDANDNKYLVGTVDAKGWYGLLTAEKQ
ncbi:hypothetical protein EDC45_0360 [Mesocricetibacter intestinalis]|uniref:Uncharacterized protein n=1 Tax=Mesocricetibacter intestinalis TaxID=1521930 RepID=A0A4R6VFQ8_9PAST|nr:proline-rich domain-containing protein [Mesocricetibacter intestinalis]TDQ59702.1 hypothetical protein EDC45_0360 [Mesocricetibacter intestinalis]